MKKLIISFFLSLFITGVSFAQPGYLGKKITASLDANLSFILNGYNYKGEQGSDKIEKDKFASLATNYNKMFTLRADKVTSRKNSIGLGLTFYRTSLKPENFGNSNSIYTDKAFFKSISPGAIVNFRKYSDYAGNLAPFGSYREIGVGLQYNAIYDSYIEDYLTKNITPFVSIAWGTQRIYFNKVIFDYGVKFAFYPTFIFKLAGSLTNSGGSHEANMNQLKALAVSRAQAMDLFTFKIGVGGLVK